MDTPASGSRYAQLNDHDWLWSHRHESNSAIAKKVGCHSDTVAEARGRLGIPPAPRGRPRGAYTVLPSVRQRGDYSPAVARILARARQIVHPPAPRDALEQFAAADRARRDHNRTLEKTAWEQLAAIAQRMVEHLDQVEQAS